MDSLNEKLPKIPTDKIYGSKVFWNKISVDTDRGSIIFTIKNYSLLNKKNKESIMSQNFSMENNKEMQWYIELYPEGETEDSSDYLSLYLCKDSKKSAEEVKASYSICILDTNNKNIEMKDTDIFSISDHEEPAGWGKRKFLKIKELFNRRATLLPNDTLTIVCSVIVGINVTQKSKILEKEDLSKDLHKKKKIKLDLQKTTDVYENLYADVSFADVTLIVEDKELKVHKCLLAAASPVFAHHFKKETNLISITDISYDIMHELIRFVYTKKVENMHNIAHELIVAADKYAIQELKNKCEETLSEIISIDNVLKIVAIANDNNAEQLKKVAVEFIIENKEILCLKPDFEETIDVRPHLYKLILLSELKSKIISSDQKS